MRDYDIMYAFLNILVDAFIIEYYYINIIKNSF